METGIVGLKRCPQEHIMGRMRKDGDQEVFELYRTAIDYGQEMPEAVDVIAVIIGRAVKIRCSLCGGLIQWNAAKPRHAARVAFE